MIDSARSRGIGGAGAAFAGDPGLAWINPAAVGTAVPHVTLGGQRGYIGDTAWQVLGASPLATGVSGFAGFAYYDAGPTTDSDGRAVSAQQDLLGDLGGSADLTPWLKAGASVKAMRSVLAGTFVARVIGADAAVRGEIGPGAVSFGIQDAGARARYQGTASPDAAAVRGGAAYEWPGDDEGSLPRLLRFAADVVAPLSGAAPEWHGGAEAVWDQGAALRAGVMRAGLPSRWAGTLGFGIGAGWYRLEYATVLGSAGGTPQIVSLTIMFKPARASELGRDVAPPGPAPVETDCREEEPGPGTPPP